MTWLDRLRAEPRLIRDAVRATSPARLVAEALLVLAVLGLALLPITLLPLPMPTTIIGAVLALLLTVARLRWPAAALIGTVGLYLVGSVAALPVIAVISFHAGRRVQPRRRLWTALAVTLLAGFLLGGPSFSFGADEVAGYALITAGLVVLPVLAGLLVGRRRPLSRVLHDRNEYLEQVRLLTAAEARTAERAHIAAEMHDLLGHRLSLISMHAGALELATAKQAPQLSEHAHLLRTTAGTAMAELRDVLGILRVGPAEELDQDSGTQADLARLVTESRRVGVDVELDWHGPDLDEVDVRVRRAVHRVVREGLTNVHKHAPAATTRVRVRTDDERVLVLVDNGPVAAGGALGTRRGLAGLEERVALAGGRFSSGSTVDGGFLVRAELPMLPPAGPAPERPTAIQPPGPLAGEVLTAGRVLGSGCLALFGALPILLIAVVVVVLGFFTGGHPIKSADYTGLDLGTGQDVVRERFGEGSDLSLFDPVDAPEQSECFHYRALDDPAVRQYKLCFRDGVLVAKEELRR
ncbi:MULTISPECIES: histidine kinase [unclassified Crossiella]|uniref:sensor histidine kinase n=1 Tax=unclassified Crossiella TaxID=2620835 RepID=UPI001FFE85B6|nr:MULTISPECIES: histidine kinase [unclassified Crossiella]MCK2242769.1 histidine kinase [Crossiella sp. S99.2]MCK2256646.1 histidine kinase [Crossiella sp. S99.1]